MKTKTFFDMHSGAVVELPKNTIHYLTWKKQASDYEVDLWFEKCFLLCYNLEPEWKIRLDQTLVARKLGLRVDPRMPCDWSDGILTVKGPSSFRYQTRVSSYFTHCGDVQCMSRVRGIICCHTRDGVIDQKLTPVSCHDRLLCLCSGCRVDRDNRVQEDLLFKDTDRSHVYDEDLSTWVEVDAYGWDAALTRRFWRYKYYEYTPSDFEAQGKSKEGMRYANVHLKKLRSFKTVYEFGRKYNLRNTDEVQLLIGHIGRWLWTVRLPQRVDKLKAFVHSWTASKHRKVILTLLMSVDHPVACLMMSSLSGRLTQERRDAWVLAEPQSFVWDLVGLALLFNILYGSYRAWASGLSFEKLVGALQAHKDIASAGVDVAKMAAPFGEIANTLKSACKRVYQFLKDFLTSAKSHFDSLPKELRALSVGLFTAVIVFMAFEFARTLFPQFYASIREWLCRKLGFDDEPSSYDFGVIRVNHAHVCVIQGPGVEAQGSDSKTVNVIEDILAFVSRNIVRKPKKFLLDHFGDLPKIVSVAKSLEWILENFEYVYNAVTECITGEPRPKSKLETDIMAFDILVTELALDLKTMATDELFSDILKLRVDTMTTERKRLDGAVVRDKKMRPVFVSKFMHGCTELEKSLSVYKNIRKTAETRAVPVMLYLYGRPGTGKTYSLNLLYRMIWSYVQKYGPEFGVSIVGPKEEFHRGHVFQINESEEFWDGYGGQFYALIDDIFQSKDPAMRLNTALKVIHMISSEPYSLRVATVEDKSHAFFKSRCLLVTSNLPPEFQGQNLGIQELSAFSSRITLAVEMTDNGFIPHPSTPVLAANGDVRQLISLDDVAMVVGESIIRRELEKSVPVVVPDLPRFVGSLKSSRLKWESHAGGSDSKDKEKEKESSPTDLELAMLLYRGCTGWGIDARLSLDVAKSFAPSFEFFECDIPLEYYDRACEKLGLVRMAGETQLKFVERIEREVVMRYGLPYLFPEYVSQVRSTGVLPASGETLQSYMARLAHESVRQEGLMKKRASYTYKSWADRISDPLGLVKEYFAKACWAFSRKGNSKFLDPETARSLMQTDPISIMTFPTGGSEKVTDMISWMQSYHSSNAVLYWGNDQSLDYEFWDPLSDWAVAYWASISEEDRQKAFALATIKSPAVPSLAVTNLTLGIMVGVIGYTLAKFVLTMMPVTATENKVLAQGKYPDEGMGKTRVRARVKRAQAKGRHDKIPPKFNSQGSNAIVDRIAANMDVIEVRISTEDASWDEVKSTPPVCSAWVLYPFSDYAVVPGHVVYGRGQGSKRWLTFARNQNYTVLESELTFVKELRGDLYLIRIPDMAPKRNILSHFADDVADFGKFAHVVPHLNDTGYDVYTAYGWDNTLTEVPVNSEYGTFETDLRFFGIPNEKGMCGTPYIHTSTGRVVALHMGGNPGQEIALGVSLLKEDLKEYDPRVDVVDPISHSLYEAHGMPGVQVLGALPRTAGSFTATKSKLRESKFDYKSAPVPPNKDGPAHLVPVEIDGVRVSPLHEALAKFANHERVPPPKRLKRVDDFLPKSFNPKNIRVLSIEEAIYGIPGVLKSIDFSTSAGYFFKRMGLSRRDLCYDGEVPRIHPLLRRAVEQRIEKAKEGIIYPVVFEEQLKDEVRSEEKNKYAKTRLFDSGDFASFVVQRMYLGMFFVEMTKDPVGSPTGLCINPHSREWGLLWSRLRGRLEERRVPGAGDFSEYDISLQNYCKAEFKRLLEPYYSAFDYVVVVLLLEANFAGWHIVGIIVFLRPWGTSSGSFITSMFNTFSNWLLHKVAFSYCYSEEEWDVVETSFTGDDSLFTVPEIYSKFNMEYLKGFLKRYFDMEYTSPSKTSKMTMDWTEVTYLKRSFVLGHFGIMAPLAERSLANMIRWTDVDQNFEVLNSVGQSVLMEAWHYGASYYEKWRSWLQAEAKRLEMNFQVPSFDDMSRMREDDYAL